MAVVSPHSVHRLDPSLEFSVPPFRKPGSNARDLLRLIAFSSLNGYVCTRQNNRPRPGPIKISSWPPCRIPSSRLPPVLSMASKSRSKMPDTILSKLDAAIQLLSVAKDACSVAPAQIALGSACALLTLIRVRSFPSFDE